MIMPQAPLLSLATTLNCVSSVFHFFKVDEQNFELKIFFLELENADGKDVLSKYSMSLNECWASKTNTVADHTYNSGNVSHSKQTDLLITLLFKGHILLWQEFCPQFPWVGPLAYNTSDIGALSGSTTNYLGEYWDSTAEIQKVHFRQFGWTADGDDEGTDLKNIFKI